MNRKLNLFWWVFAEETDVVTWWLRVHQLTAKMRDTAAPAAETGADRPSCLRRTNRVAMAMRSVWDAGTPGGSQGNGSMRISSEWKKLNFSGKNPNIEVILMETRNPVFGSAEKMWKCRFERMRVYRLFSLLISDWLSVLIIIHVDFIFVQLHVSQKSDRIGVWTVPGGKIPRSRVPLELIRQSIFTLESPHRPEWLIYGWDAAQTQTIIHVLYFTLI